MNNKLNKYPAYKDSGVEWMGDISEHWELTKLGTRFEERKTKVSDKDYAPYRLQKTVLFLNWIVPQKVMMEIIGSWLKMAIL